MGSNLLQKWIIKWSNRNNVSNVGEFLKSTKMNNPRATQEQHLYILQEILSCI